MEEGNNNDDHHHHQGSNNDLIDIDELNHIPTISIDKMTEIERRDRQYKQSFENMEKQVQECREKLKSIEKFKQDISQMEGIFDREDIDEVNKAFDQESQQLKLLEESLDLRLKYYYTVVLKMKKNLEIRRTYLDKYYSENKWLQDNEKLLDFFVNKQAGLTRQCDVACAKLISPVNVKLS